MIHQIEKYTIGEKHAPTIRIIRVTLNIKKSNPHRQLELFDNAKKLKGELIYAAMHGRRGLI